MIRIIVASNLWISLGAASFVLMHYVLGKKPLDFWYILFIFLTTFIAYNFQRIVKLKKAEKEGKKELIDRLSWLQNHQIIIWIFMMIAGVISVYLFFYFQWHILPYLVVASFLSLFYVVKIPLFSKPLREVPGLKIFLIAFSYGICTVLIPFYENPFQEQWWLFSACFFYLIAITIPFDIRDYEIDEKSIKTIPQLLGIRNAKLLALLLLILSMCLYFFYSPFITWGILGLVTAFFIIGSTTNNNSLWYGLGIDGLLIVGPILLFTEVYLL